MKWLIIIAIALALGGVFVWLILSQALYWCNTDSGRWKPR